MEEVLRHDDPALSGVGRSGMRLALDPVFGSYLLGKLLSLIGLWAHNLVCAVLIYQITGSAVLVGLVSLAQFGPQIVFAAWSGSLADRSDRVLQLVLGRILAVGASAGLAVWCLFGVDRPGTTVAILLASLLMGAGQVIGGPAMMALVPALAPSDQLAAAVRLDSLPMLLGRTVGPAVGAVMLAVLDAAAAFFVAAGGSLVFVVVLLGIRRRVARPAAGVGDRSMRAAVDLVRRHPRLGLLLLAVAGAAFGADPSLTLAPAIAASNGEGQAVVGFYTGAFGLGAALGALAMGQIGRILSLAASVSTGLMVLALSTAALALPLGPAASVTAFAASGTGMSLALIGCTTLLQMAVPDGMRGRLMSLWLICFVGMRPVAALTDGALADLFSVDIALVAVAVLVAVSAWLCRPARLAVVPLAATAHEQQPTHQTRHDRHEDRKTT